MATASFSVTITATNPSTCTGATRTATASITVRNQSGAAVAGASVKATLMTQNSTVTKTAVTGTNGKTTISTLLRHLLQSDGSQWGLVGTVRYHLGRRSIPSYKTTPDSADDASDTRM